MLNIIRYISIIMVLNISVIATDEINVTITEVNASCGIIQEGVKFKYDNWFSFCPFSKTGNHQREEADLFLQSHNYYYPNIPNFDCNISDDIKEQEGIRYSVEIPKGYIIKSKTLESNTSTYFHAFEHNKYKTISNSNFDIEGFTNQTHLKWRGLRVNGHLLHGYCHFAPAGNCTTAWLTFKADIYDGILNKRVYKAIYKKECSKPDIAFPPKFIIGHPSFIQRYIARPFKIPCQVTKGNTL